MAKTFLFYDLETTGLDKSFDQVQQFAAIRTDLDLNELERHEIFIRINPDVIPNPEAVLVHRVCVDQCEAIGLCEYEGIKAIHALLNTPQTISIGYNTLGFDDEFLRFSFYRNLLTPYTHQYANGCGRADLFPITALFRWQESECLNWPEREGKPTLKLECINEVNQLAQGQVHNALVDVEATIALAKKLKQQDSQWDYALHFFDKTHEQKRLKKLSPPQEYPHLPVMALLIDGGFGPKNHYQMPVLLLGHHVHYRNQTMWLRLDDTRLTAFGHDEFLEHARIIRKKQAESPFFLPYHPRFCQKLSTERQAIVQETLRWLAEHPKWLSSLTEKVTHACYPDIDNLPIEASLYQNPFPDQATSRALVHFHQAQDKWASINKLSSPYRELGLRLMVRNYPEQCDKQHLETFHQHCHNVFAGQINHQNKTSRSLSEVIDDLNQMDTQRWDEAQTQLMSTLIHHLTQKKSIHEA